MATDQPRRPAGSPSGGQRDEVTCAGPEPSRAPGPAWPTHGAETIEWHSADARPGPRTSRSQRTGPYEASIPPGIADAALDLPSPTIALVTEASAEMARFDGETLGSTMSYAALLLRTEAASSSQIENLTSSAKAIALAELGRKGRANADEIVANVTAMTEALELAKHLDADAILRMHRTLMSPHTPSAAGVWRTEQVWIGGSATSPHGATYVAPVHERVPAAIDDLVAFIRRDDLPVLAQAALTHAQFESIHPFTDGNGRTGRALLHAQLRNGGLARQSIVPVSAGLLVDTDRYFDALIAYRDGDVDLIVAEVAGAVFPALANSRQLITDVRTARAAWDDRIRARRGAAAWGLADLLITRPVVDTRLVADQLGVAAVNAQLAIDRLVEDGVLEQIGRGARDRVWQAVEVLDAMERFASRSHRRVW